ncbi:MAG: alanine racemase [Microbacteriaceae bacterium]
MSEPLRAATIDTAAIRHNVGLVLGKVGDRALMAVVAHNGYGHGAIAVAREAIASGAQYLAVSTVTEGIRLREAGIAAPILAWRHPIDADFLDAAVHQITPAIASIAELEAAAAAGVGEIHLAAAVGRGLLGCLPEDWSGLIAGAAELESADGGVWVTGIMGRGEQGQATAMTLQRELDEFEALVQQARAVGLRPKHTHLGGSAAVLNGSLGGQTMLRVGRALYGLSPFDGEAAEFGLAPAMRLTARVIATKRIEAGEGISYGYTYRSTQRSNLALVAIGYVHGVDRSASNRAFAQLHAARHPIAGRVAMDVFVLDLKDDHARVGEDVVLFGDPSRGDPALSSWAAAVGRRPEEVVTDLAATVRRIYR